MFETEALLRLLFSVLGITILFVTFKMKLDQDTKKARKSIDAFFVSEQEANFTRKSEIPDTLFVNIHFDCIPAVADDACQSLYRQIAAFSQMKMVYLKNATNLELKKNYGISSFEQLIDYEKKYFAFMDILVQYGMLLYQKKFLDQAQSVLEMAVDNGCDRSNCFKTLAAIYRGKKDRILLDRLETTARQNMQGSYYAAAVYEFIQNAKKDIEQ